MNATRFSFEGYPWEYCYKSRWISWVSLEGSIIVSKEKRNLYLCLNLFLSLSLFHLSSPPSLYSGMCVFVFFYFGLSFSSYANVQVVFVNSSKELLKNPSVMLKFAHNSSFVVHNPVFLVYGYQVTILHYLVFFSADVEELNRFLVHMWCISFVLFNQMWLYMCFQKNLWLYMYWLSEYICRMKPPNCAHGLGGKF